jgi:chitodextrinase
MGKPVLPVKRPNPVRSLCASLPWSVSGTLLAAAVLAVLMVCVGSAGAATQLLGSSVLQASSDSDLAGQAEAFQTTAAASGTVASLSVYLDAGSTATKLVAGVYTDSSGRPGTLLGQASRSTPAAGAWNTLAFASPFAVTSGQTYWIALLGAGGTLAFRDCQGCVSGGAVSSSQTGLTALPASWSSGSVWNDGILSAYALAGTLDTTAPSTPTGLAVSNASASALTLSWSASSDNVGVAGYKTFLNGTAAATVTSGLSSTFTGLACGTTYTLGVAAYDAAGNQSATATVSASTGRCPDTSPPSAPTALAVSSLSGTGMTLSWGASSDNVGVTGYKLFLNGSQVATTTSLSYAYAGLACATSYTLGVAAYDAAGNTSTLSSKSASTLACAPANTALPVLSGSVQVGLALSTSTGSWSGTPTSYAYQWLRCDSSGASCATIAGATSSAYTLVSADRGATIRARVTASNAAGSASATSAQSAVVAATAGLVAAYSFDEGAGSSAADASGNGNTGSLVNATWAAAGKYGGAASFNGSNALVSVPDSSSLDLSAQMTLEAWVDPNAFTHSWDVLLMKAQPNDLVYALYAQSNLNSPAGLIYSNGVEHTLTGTSPLPTGAWSFLAASYDGSSLKLYLNGTLVSQLSYTGAITVSTGPFTIGGNNVWNEWFSGLIDNVRVYNRALSAAELQTDMTTPIASAAAAPANSSPPLISGSANVGSILSSSTGSWSGSPTSYAYQWQRCNSSGASCAAIAGANASTYTLVSADQGTTIRVQVTASNSRGSASTVSAQTALVAAAATTTPITWTKIVEDSDTDMQFPNAHLFPVCPTLPAGSPCAAAGDTLILLHTSTVDATDGTGGIYTGPSPPAGVSDPGGNTWVQDYANHPGTTYSTVEAWSAYLTTALTAGQQIAVVGYSRGLSDVITVLDVKGVAGPADSARFDEGGHDEGYTSTPSATLARTTAQPHELLIGVHSQSSLPSPFWTPAATSPAWNEATDLYVTNTIDRGHAVQVREVTSSGQYTSTGTATGTTTFNSIILAYKAAH